MTEKLIIEKHNETLKAELKKNTSQTSADFPAL